MNEAIEYHRPLPFMRHWLLWVWSGNLFFLAADYAVKAGWTGNLYVRKLGPSWEYTLGNLWSGALLMASAVLTLAAASAARRGTAHWWALVCLACLGMGLSLDEVGSLHERVSALGPLNKQWNLLPFAAVSAGVVMWLLWVIRRTGAAGGRACVMILAGFVCLGMAEPIDLIEHAYPWPSGFEAFGALLEEGIELLGGTLLLTAAAGMYRRAALSPAQRRSAVLRGLAAAGYFPLVSVVPLVLTRAYLQKAGSLDLHLRGDFGAMPAVMVLLLIGWACVLGAALSRNRRGLWFFAACGSVVGAIELGCNLIVWITRESHRSPAGVWWVQVGVAVLGYLALRTVIARITPVTGSSRAGVA